MTTIPTARTSTDVGSGMAAQPAGAARRRNRLRAARGDEPAQSTRSFRTLAAAAVRLMWSTSPRLFLAGIGLQLLAGAALAGQLVVVKAVLSEVLRGGPGPDLGRLLPHLAAASVATALVMVASVAQRAVGRMQLELAALRTQHLVFEAANRAELSAFEDPVFYDRLQRAKQRSLAPIPITMAMTTLGGAVTAVAAVGSVLVVLTPAVVPMVLVGFVPIILAARHNGTALYAMNWGSTPDDRAAIYIDGVLTSRETAAEVRAYGLAPFFRAKYDEFLGRRMDKTKALVRSELRRSLVAALASTTARVGAVAYLVWLVADGQLAPAGAAVAAAALVQLAGRLDGALAAAATLHEQVLFLDDFVTFLELGKDAGVDSADVTTAPSSSASLGNIRVDHLGFSYPGTNRPVLRDVSLELPAGKVIALVGENGAGKTTLAKIISGLYRPTAGSVTADGRKLLGDIDSPASRSRIAVLFQDFAKYQLSAWDNIQVGDTGRGADRAAMIEAARRSRAEEFLLKLPDGFDSMLSRQFGGLDLSIGQWQRIALARAFYRDAELVILDEPTAAIDARSEHELFDDIRSLCHDRSVLLVSHRFSTVRAADRIYVLHDGQISEEGTHDELMALGGTYHELFTLQASSYIDHSTNSPATSLVTT